MRRIPVLRPIAAIIYSDRDIAAAVLRRIRGRLAEASATCAGFLQQDAPPRADRSHCDMVLECVATGRRIPISEDRGALARGCRLDVGELMGAIATARDMLQAGPDVLIVNKFGKTEGLGGGFRPLIADALELGIPVLITVPWRNIEGWRLFSGDLAVEFRAEALSPEDDAAVMRSLGLCAAVEHGTTGDPVRPAGSATP